MTLFLLFLALMPTTLGLIASICRAIKNEPDKKTNLYAAFWCLTGILAIISLAFPDINILPFYEA